MAKKISLKKELGKKTKIEENSDKYVKIDVTEEELQRRAKVREHLPSATYVNTYQTKDRGKNGDYTVDLTEFVEKYPQNKIIIDQLIVGANVIIKPDQSRNTIYQIFEGIQIFVEFLNSEKNLSNSHVISVSDINITVAKSFSNYLLSVYPKSTQTRKWYGALKRSVTWLQALYPKEPLVGRGFIWPYGPGNKEKVTEGYHPREMKELIEACIEDIKNVMNFHQTYTNLEHELVTEEWNLENVMHYINERWGSLYFDRYRCSEIGLINLLVKGSPRLKKFLINHGYTNEQIYNLYIQRGSELALRGRSPYATTIKQHPYKESALAQFNLALATLKKRYPEFPYYCSVDEVKKFFSKRNSRNLNNNLNNNSLYKLIYRAVNLSVGKIDFMDGRLGYMAVYAAKHFVIDTIYPFLLLTLINTGWNLESILSISDNVDAHTTPDLIDPENYLIIHGKKVRGSKSDRPSKVTHRSSIKNKFGTYRLLKYVETIINQYKDSTYFRKGFLWQYTVIYPKRDNTIIRTLNEMPDVLFDISIRFVERHKFKYFSDKSISHPKIRSGYSALRQLLGATEREISEDLNHKNEETVIHYTSDDSSNMVLDMTIKKIQKQFIDDLKNFKARVVKSQTLQELRKVINEAQAEDEKKKLIKKESSKLGLEEKTIVHLMDAGSQKYILACEDSKKPSWPSFEEYVREGQNCRYFNKCSLCQQAIVFPEALPYIARRILDLDKLKSILASSEWILKYGDEYDAWIQILDNWSNQEQVENAWGLARTGFVVLPQVMRGV